MNNDEPQPLIGAAERPADICPACGREHWGAGLCVDCILEDTQEHDRIEPEDTD